jgi:hypothetical protein
MLVGGTALDVDQAANDATAIAGTNIGVDVQGLLIGGKDILVAQDLSAGYRTARTPSAELDGTSPSTTITTQARRTPLRG